MNFVLTPKEYEEKKKEVVNKFNDFFKSYDEFTCKTAPKNWRTSGNYYMSFNKFIEDIKNFEPLTQDQFQKLSRDQVEVLLKPEEFEIWDAANKYNL
jgi:hypothetical protein